MQTNDLGTEISTGENTDHQDFEDYLKDIFMEEVPEDATDKETFDDNFDTWLYNLDSEEWLEYGNKFKRVHNRVEEIPQFKGTNEALDNLRI